MRASRVPTTYTATLRQEPLSKEYKQRTVYPACPGRGRGRQDIETRFPTLPPIIDRQWRREDKFLVPRGLP